jgi:cold shock CspA family protein/ribosome-associated translation inhibitor RaiA
MQTPLRVEFRGIRKTDELRKTIAAHVNELESRFGRITACHVIVTAPSERHRSGGLYEVHIGLTLPGGRQVNIGRTPHADERHAKLEFALADAFHRARRRLQDQVRRMQGQTKKHAPEPIGVVSRLEPEEGFGMLTTSDEREIYFHRNSVLNNAFSKLKIGTRVRFAEEMGEKGPQASTVKLLGRHGLR